MNKINSYIKSIFATYLLWYAILVCYGAWTIVTSDFTQKLNEAAFNNFILMYVIGVVIYFIPGAVFAWFTQQGKSWAFWLFAAYCSYRSIDSIWGLIMRIKMEHITVNNTDWVIAIAISVIWVLLIGSAWVACTNKSLNLTGAENAPSS
jgi:hypothetical protein